MDQQLDIPDAAAAQDAEIDKLLAEIESPAEPRQMAGDEPAPAQQEAPTWNGQEWEFEWNGKKIVPDSKDKALIWMGQGYNYATRMGEFNNRVKDFETRERTFSERERALEPFIKLEEYARQNPDWAAHVNKAFEEQQRGGQLDPTLERALAPILSELGQVREFIGSAQQEKRLAEETKADQALDQEIGEIRKKFPNIDLNSRDESGETLERRILLHADKNGIRSFGTAFKDYLHDKLIEDARAQARQGQVKEREDAARRGFLGSTSSSVKQLKPVNTRASWSDPQFDSKNILKEIGIGG